MDASFKFKFKTVDEYIALQPDSMKPLLQSIRSTIQDAAPDAQEVISYNMPAYKLYGMLVFFAAYKNHIGFYPTSSGIIAFKDVLGPYKTTKGAIQFPIEQEIPLELVRDIVLFRVEENLMNHQLKSKRK